MTFNSVHGLAFVLFLGGLSVVAIGAEPVAGAVSLSSDLGRLPLPQAEIFLPNAIVRYSLGVVW